MCRHCRAAELSRAQARFWLRIIEISALAKRVLYVDLLNDALTARAEAHALAPDEQAIC